MRHALASSLALLVLVTAPLAGNSRLQQPQQPPAMGSVTVSVTYKGKGTVDATHQIFVFLFRSPELTAQSEPIAMRPATKNGDKVVFDQLRAEPVYVVAVYNESGTYSGQNGPPPAGTPYAQYRRTPKGAPTPVTPGPNATVSFTFDDSTRWER